MALGVTVNSSHVPGDKRSVRFTLTLDNSYPTGGYPMPTPAQLGLVTITSSLPVCFSSAPPLPAALDGGDFVLNKTTNKLQMIAASGAELAAASSLTGVTIEGLAEGF